MTSFRKFFSGGPQSGINDIGEIDPCKEGWWSNLLYINNLEYYFNDHKEYGCIAQSWYLANDMQFYIISPLLIFPMWKFPMVGMVLSTFWLIAATISPLLIAYYKELGFGMSLSLDVVQYVYEFYFVPWCRFQPYVLGRVALH